MTALSSQPSVTAHRIRHSAGAVLPRHRHDSGQLVVMEAGTQRITCDHGWWLSPSGQGVWLPAGLPHRADYSEDAVLLRIELPSDGFGELPADCKVFRVSGLLRELMVHALELSVPGRDNQDAGWVLALIADQVRRSPAGLGFYLPAGRDRRLRRVMALLEADPGARLSMEELSALAHCSLRTLLRLFETETGMSFQRWRERLRMIVASDRLARGCSVTETALILGYRSTGSFSTMFFRVLGIRPSQVASKPRHGSM